MAGRDEVGVHINHASVSLHRDIFRFVVDLEDESIGAIHNVLPGAQVKSLVPLTPTLKSPLAIMARKREQYRDGESPRGRRDPEFRGHYATSCRSRWVCPLCDAVPAYHRWFREKWKYFIEKKVNPPPINDDHVSSSDDSPAVQLHPRADPPADQGRRASSSLIHQLMSARPQPRDLIHELVTHQVQSSSVMGHHPRPLAGRPPLRPTPPSFPPPGFLRSHGPICPRTA